jgi:hypothetical protein
MVTDAVTAMLYMISPRAPVTRPCTCRRARENIEHDSDTIAIVLYAIVLYAIVIASI